MTDLEWSDETSRAYARYMAKNVRYDYRKWAARILEDRWARSPGSTIVDVAGGPGFLLFELGAHVDRPRLVFVDGSATMLDLAIENGRSYSLVVETHRSEAERMDLPDEFADIVVCKHFIRLSPEAGQAVREMGRILKKGGRVYVIDFDGEASRIRKGLLYLWILFTAPAFIRSALRDAMRSGFSASRITAMMRDAGLQNVRVLAHGVSYLVAGERG